MLAQCITSTFHIISTLTLGYTLRVASNMTSQCEVTNIATVIQHCCKADKLTARQMNKGWTERVKESWRREGDQQSVRQHGSSQGLYTLSHTYTVHVWCIWPFPFVYRLQESVSERHKKKGGSAVVMAMTVTHIDTITSATACRPLKDDRALFDSC